MTPSASPQVLKSTGDVAGGRALYEGYAAVTDVPPECFLTLRDTVLLRKESRKLIVQPNTRLEGNRLLSPLRRGPCSPVGAQKGPGTDWKAPRGDSCLSLFLPQSSPCQTSDQNLSICHHCHHHCAYRVALVVRWQQKV